jgi:pilin isopeptide linkage protein
MKCYKGIVEFPEICFTEPGKYNYTIRETTQTNQRWVTDDRIYRAIITVTENKNGSLTAVVEYPDGFPAFVNRYCPPVCCCKKKHEK